MNTSFLIAEYCDAPFYMGWHLYLRDNKEMQKRNRDGTWGWLRGVHRQGENPVQQILNELGIKIQGDGTCDYDGIAEIARRFPIPGQTVGDRLRGCIEVVIGEHGKIIMKNIPPEEHEDIRCMDIETAVLGVK